MASGSWTAAIGAATLPDVAAGRPRPHRSTATTCCLHRLPRGPLDVSTLFWVKEPGPRLRISVPLADAKARMESGLI